MKKRFLICGTLIVLNLALIWGNSALPGGTSTQLSDGFLEMMTLAFPTLGWISAGLIRKIAHFAEFTSLGLLLGWLFYPGKEHRFPTVTEPALFGLLSACLDETIQCFVPGRQSSLMDVWIDFSGICTGILLLCLGHCCYRCWNKHRNNT